MIALRNAIFWIKTSVFTSHLYYFYISLSCYSLYFPCATQKIWYVLQSWHCLRYTTQHNTTL